MAEYIEYHPLKFWLDPASIAEIVAHIQAYLVANPINSTTEIETIIHDYIIANPELVGGVDSVNGETGEVILTADNISAGENVTIKDVLDSLQDQIDDIVVSIPSDYQQLINDVSDLKSAVDAGCETQTVALATTDFTSGIVINSTTGVVTSSTNYKVLNKNLHDLLPSGATGVSLTPASGKRVIVNGFSQAPSLTVGDDNSAILVSTVSGAASETIEVTLDKDLYYIVQTNEASFSTVTAFVWAGSAVKDLIGLTEVFPICSVLSASISQNGNIKSNSDCRTVYFPAEPNQTYVVRKPAGQRFVVGECDVLPALNGTMLNIVTDNTASQITFKTSAIAQYVGVFCFYAETDTDITPVKMCQSVQIFIPSTRSDAFYREQYAVTPYMIYDGTKNLPYNVFRKTITNSLQSIGYHDGKKYVIYTGGMRIYAANGIPQVLTFEDLAHPQYCEDIGDALLITTTDEDGYRSVYTLDYESLEFTKLFTFTDINAVSVSKVADTTYKVIAWSGETNALIFYDYDSTTAVLTEIGQFTLSRKYYQGGCRINNVYYMMTNSNGTTDSLVEIVDGDTFTKIGQITIKGLGECEGFFVYVDGESVYAYMVSNTYNRVIKIKLV